MEWTEASSINTTGTDSFVLCITPSRGLIGCLSIERVCPLPWLTKRQQGRRYWLETNNFVKNGQSLIRDPIKSTVTEGFMPCTG